MLEKVPLAAGNWLLASECLLRVAPCEVRGSGCGDVSIAHRAKRMA